MENKIVIGKGLGRIQFGLDRDDVVNILNAYTEQADTRIDAVLEKGDLKTAPLIGNVVTGLLDLKEAMTVAA